MSSGRKCRLAVVTAIVVAGAVGVVAETGGPGPVPHFDLVRLDGTATTSLAEVGAGTHLIVYLSPGSPPSDHLLRQLKAWDSDALRARTVVVVGRDLANAREWVRAAGDDLQPLRFVVDVGGDGWRALGLTGAPHVVGVAGGEVRWRVAGALRTPRALESIVKTWVGRP